MIQPVSQVKITKLTPIFKAGVEASRIELANFSFLDGGECGFNVIVGKGEFQVGGGALYIQPDYCLPNHSLFMSLIAPDGDEKRTKLGRENRIRAIKFNFTLENSSTKLYSVGVLLSVKDVSAEVLNAPDLTEALGITKYEEPENLVVGNVKGNIPSFLYKTDETNCENLKSEINNILSPDGVVLVWTVKYDGSSFTQYFKKDEEGNWYTGICSRNLEKKLDEDSSDAWVSLSKKSGLYARGMEYCKKHNVELAFRGEIYGAGLKGSGNKYNPHAKLDPDLCLFGVDDLSLGYAERINCKDRPTPYTIFNEARLRYMAPTPFIVNNYDELMAYAQQVFEYEKRIENRIIEGIVVRTRDSNALSCKIMNPEYDSKK